MPSQIKPLGRPGRTPIIATALAGLALTSTPLTAANIAVSNCGDGGVGSGSLRDIVENVAQSGDTVDLSQLPAACNMTNSTITLIQGEIAVKQDTLTLMGPEAGSGTVTISGNHASRVLNHSGQQELTIAGLKIKDGAYSNLAGNASGGCITSNANIFLLRSIVSGCSVVGSVLAKGGGVYAKNNLAFHDSALTGNYVNSTTKIAQGGGAFARGTLTSKYSVIDGNNAHAGNGSGQHSEGGGVSVGKGILVVGSTISRNSSYQIAAIEGGGYNVTIRDSTISGNSSKAGNSAVLNSGPLTISNSTIAFNTSTLAVAGAALSVGSTLSLQSVIVSNNTSGGQSSGIIMFNAASIAGANNLIAGPSNAPLPADTITGDPKLAPLAFNGGPTQTHELLSGSPAIGAGNNWVNRSFDQRGHGYPRVSGASLGVDIGAIQFDSIFFNDFEN